MATSSHIEDVTKRVLRAFVLRAFVEGGAGPGDELRDLPSKVHLPGSMAEGEGWPDHALQQGWAEKRPGDQYLRLTSAGYAMTQSK